MALSKRLAPYCLLFIASLTFIVLRVNQAHQQKLLSTVENPSVAQSDVFHGLTNPMESPGVPITIKPGTPTIEGRPLITVGPDGNFYIWISGDAAQWIVIAPPTDCDGIPSEISPSCWQGKI